MTGHPGDHLSSRLAPRRREEFSAHTVRRLLLTASTGRRGDVWFQRVVAACAVALLVIALAIAVSTGVGALPAIQKFGLAFIVSQDWDPVAGTFGALPFIFGTLASSVLALLIAAPLGIAAAVALSEFVRGPIRGVLSALIELLAAVPSVVYGLWGIFVLAPILRSSVEPALTRSLGFVPLFSGPPYGVGMLAAGLILAVMILPTVTAVSRDVLLAVPRSQREGMLALGATNWEAIWWAVLPSARSGILGGVVLGLGRALGETMAVTMVIGNRPAISPSLFAPSYTMASVIANEFAEATSDLHLAALLEIGLLLLVVTILVNAIARLLIWRMTRGGGLTTNLGGG